MTAAHAVANLHFFTAAPRRKGWLLPVLLRVEAWFDDRASRRDLYRLDDHALADIGLSRADVERVNDAPSWRDPLLVPFGQR